MSPARVILVSMCCALCLASPESAPDDGNHPASAPTGAKPRQLADASRKGPAPNAMGPSDIAIGPEHNNNNLVDLVLSAPEVLNTRGSIDTTYNILGCDFMGDDLTQLWCVDANDWLFTYDVSDGSRTDIAVLNPPPPGDEVVSGLAWDHSTAQMFMCAADLSPATSHLLRVDPAGSTVLLGEITGTTSIAACAADPLGNLWGYDWAGDLWSIDKRFGTGTKIGSLGFVTFGDGGMDFDDEDGSCYLFAYNVGTCQNELRRCDTSSGATTLVGVLGATAPGGTTNITGAGVATLRPTPTMFATSSFPFTLLGIDLSAVRTYAIGPSGESVIYSGMAWDSWHSTMYVSGVGNNYDELGIVDITTGAVTLVGPYVNSSYIRALFYDSNRDALWGWYPAGDCFVTFDRSTGETYLFSCCDYGGGRPDRKVDLLITGMSYDAFTDTIYGIDVDYLYGFEMFWYETHWYPFPIFSIPHNIPTSSAYDMGLVFDSATRELYAVLTEVRDRLYRIDTATGAAEFLGYLGNPSGLTSMAATTAPTGPIIFHDGFESGDTTAWALTID